MLGGAQQAIGPLDRVITEDPKNAEAYKLRGSAYAGFKLDKAIADLQEAISLDPDDYESYLHVGRDLPPCRGLREGGCNSLKSRSKRT